jgi:cytochrome P450
MAGLIDAMVSMLEKWDARKIAEFIASLGAAAGAILAAHSLQTWRMKRALPPGPWPYPVVGNFPHLMPGGPHRALQGLHQRYGPMLTLWYGSKLTIVLGDPNVVQQTHRNQSDKFQHRTLTAFAKLSLKADEEGGKNVALSGGKYWVKARKVFVQELMSKKFIEKGCLPKIMEEIWSTVDAMKGLNGAPFDPHEHLQRLSCNIVYRLTYGIRFKRSDIGNKDSDWGQLHNIINSIMQLGGQNVKANYSPLLKFIELLTPKGRALNKRRLEVVSTRDRILERLLKEHKQKLDPSNPKDFLDVLLTRQEKDGLSDLEIMFIAWEFITAGTDTTSATMHWLTLLLANHPEVQKKAQAEIDNVCKGRPVDVSDQDKLPYVNACVKECMRWMPAVPLMVPYKASADAEVRSGDRTYTIPEGTQVIVNGFNMHRDPELWKDPDVFNPERFMEGPDADIELKGADAPNNQHHLKFMPLGTGRRACAGYLLAKLELFLQGATLIQCFDWKPAAGAQVPLKEVFGIAVSAAHADVTATWRTQSDAAAAAATAQFGAHA